MTFSQLMHASLFKAISFMMHASSNHFVAGSYVRLVIRFAGVKNCNSFFGKQAWTNQRKHFDCMTLIVA